MQRIAFLKRDCLKKKGVIKMKFVIPVVNLTIHSIIKLDRVVLLPHTYFLQEEAEVEIDDEILLSYEMGNLPKVLGEAWHYCKQDFFDKNVTIAVIEVEISDNDFYDDTPLQNAYLLNKICTFVDKELDYIRLRFCDHSQIDSIPTFPGIFKGYMRGAMIDESSNRCRSLNGKICSNLNQHGLGVFADMDTTITEDTLYKLLFCNRDDEVYLRCRCALRRVSETYYFPNKDTIFVYLMSTIELLASEHFENFKKVKSKIIPFLTTSKNRYHDLAAEFRELSENLRTNVVHCGKNLYDVLPSEKDVDNVNKKIVKYIITYCSKVISLKIYNYVDLEKERNELLKKMEM